MTTYRNGNRLQVPKTLGNQHFLYLAEPRAIDLASRDIVVEAAKRHIYGVGLSAGHIELINRRQLGKEGCSALERLELPLINLKCARETQTDVLITSQAFPHTDPFWDGAAFLSVVLHTGPEDYLMQTLHTGKDRSGALEVKASSRVIKPGDWFVFDPSTPHFTAPLHTHQDNLLILLQIELDDDSLEEREAILRELPARAGDRNIDDFSFL